MATENLSSILNTLGGTRTTTSPGDTAALRQLLGQLQGADYQGLLDSVFQQASAKVPQIQVGLANALGARSGTNSAVASALLDLQKQTSIAGLDAITKAQLQNQNIQQAAAGNIASATRGTTQKSGTNLGQAAAVLSALAGLKKSGLLADMGLGSSTATPVNSAVFTPAPVFNLDSPVTSAPAAAPVFSAEQYPSAEAFGVPAQTYLQPTSLDQPTYEPIQFVAPEQAQIQPDNPNVDFNVPDELFLADGGLVGRDGKKLSLEAESAEDTAEDTAEARSNARFDVGFTANAFMDKVQEMLGALAGEPRGYADGGLVRASGSRRSSNPTVQTDPVQAMQALLESELLQGRQQQLAPRAPRAALQASGMESSGSSSSSSSGLGPVGTADTGRVLSQAAAINALSGLTGGPTIPTVGGIGLGSMASMANARSGSDAAMAGLQALASSAGATAGAAFSAGKSIYENNASRLIDTLAMLNPATAVANLGSSLLGGPTAGSLLAGTPAQIPSGSGPVTEATMGFLGDMGLTSGGGALYGESPAQTFAVPNSSVQATSLGEDSGDTSTYSPQSAADTAASFAHGGEVDGPGTGTSDSIKARLSDGEYVISADVVNKLGVEFFDMLQKELHTPTSARR